MRQRVLTTTLFVCLFISILLSACASGRQPAMVQNSSGTASGEETTVTETVSIIPPVDEKYVVWNGEADFNALYATASEEIQKELDAYKKTNKEDYYNNERAIKVILGILPENMPRITLESAKEIIQKHDAVVYESKREYLNIIINDFNKIHGYPDQVFLYPGGNFQLEYYLDNDVSKNPYIFYVNSYACVIEYLNTATGERETIATYVDKRSPLDKEWALRNWDNFYKAATPEQKAKLDALKAEHPQDYDEWAKEIFIIIGMLPEDTPRATMEQVKAVMAEMKQIKYDNWNVRYWDFQKRMNKLCGYADHAHILSDDLITHGVKYYFNDEHTEYVFFTAAGYAYYRNLETGVNEEITSYYKN